LGYARLGYEVLDLSVGGGGTIGHAHENLLTEMGPERKMGGLTNYYQTKDPSLATRARRLAATPTPSRRPGTVGGPRSDCVTSTLFQAAGCRVIQ
jgi:hypothetical protein